MNAPGFPHAQRGQSLIAMMVGMVISLMTIAAMLVMYKNMIETTANASRSALRDGQVSAALLGAEMDLQEAGFGIAISESLDSRFSLSDQGRQLRWRFKSALGQPDSCAGLRIIDAAGGTLPRGLYKMPPKSCSSAASVTWSDTQLQPVASDAAFFEPTQKDGSAFGSGERELGALSLAVASGGTGYRFSAVADACMPFHQQDSVTQAGQRVTLAQSTNDVLFSVCLPNLVSPSTP